MTPVHFSQIPACDGFSSDRVLYHMQSCVVDLLNSIDHLTSLLVQQIVKAQWPHTQHVCCSLACALSKDVKSMAAKRVSCEMIVCVWGGANDEANGTTC